MLFDTAGGRTHDGQHVKSKEATERAKKRRSREKANRHNNVAAIAKPTLEEEIKLFKAICRHILQNDLRDNQRTWFRMEQRSHLRRLGLLGIEGNQPAVAAFCETSTQEDDIITKAIIQQKVGANPKAIKAHTEMTAAKEEASSSQTKHLSILYKKARIAYGATIRWKRSITGGHDTDQTIDDTNENDGENGVMPGVPNYTTRRLNCIRCGASQETRWMQLRVREGFRAIHCHQCKLQQRCSRNTCQCGTIWHHCTTHRTDPATHKSRKAP